MLLFEGCIRFCHEKGLNEALSMFARRSVCGTLRNTLRSDMPKFPLMGEGLVQKWLCPLRAILANQLRACPSFSRHPCSSFASHT